MQGAGGRGAGLISLICCQLSWFWSLVAPGLVSSEQESPVPPSCVLGFSVPALKQLCILSGVSLEASSIFCPNWPRFTKWSVYACHTEINQVFFHGKSVIFPFIFPVICLQVLINRKSSRSRKHNAKSC